MDPTTHILAHYLDLDAEIARVTPEDTYAHLPQCLECRAAAPDRYAGDQIARDYRFLYARLHEAFARSSTNPWRKPTH
jgi:predicted anti-sigma-YlaC factor YlaD